MHVSLIKGNTREYWFVLSSDNLTWYKDDEVSFPVEPALYNYRRVLLHLQYIC